MIQSGLFFVLGFLVAGFIALLLAPAIWRRAVYLTRKRVESAVPLTVNEIQADKDKLRAEHAMALRKIEISLDKHRNKTTDQANQIVTLSEEVKMHKAEVASQTEANSQLEKKYANLNNKLDAKASEVEETKFQISTTSAELSARTGELESLTHLHQELEKSVSIKDAKIGDLELDNARSLATISELKEKRRKDQEKVRDARSETRSTAELLKNDKERIAALEKKYERLVAEKSDLEVKLIRRDKDIARIKEKRSDEKADIQEFELKLADSEAERKSLENELADLTLRFNKIANLAGSDNPEKAIEAAGVKHAKLELDFETLKQERDSLKAKLQSAKNAAKAPVASKASTKGLSGDDALREELSNLAAEVVHMTALVEGKDSRINKLIDSASNRENSDVVSLADRVKALKKAAQETAN